ncbi:MAG: RHS repeat-associated core domain-containing protein, partial [Verrucomicrobiota bacterium]|nr:RHS repeat-associated core domain-containing protein [Verrucomicrobiota bacterium]
LQSSDGSIDYTYQPNALGQVLSSTDHKTGLKTIRDPDPQGNLLTETLANGLAITKTYDRLNRCKTLHFPDGSLLSKDYDPVYLREVSYAGLTHRYVKYDLSGHLLEEELPLNAGKVTTDIDLLGRASSVRSPYHSQTVGSFDAVGKIESLRTQLPSYSESIHFTYDSLGQLTKDGQHSYSSDSHYNRLSQDQARIQVNDLNQLVDLQYDLNGNPILKDSLKLSYDALDRLVAIDFPDKATITYTYDPFHRRLTKTTPDKTTRYLYDGNDEIGFEENGHLSLRILGDTPQAEIGSAVIFQLNGSVVLPLHDLQGNVSLLLDPIAQTTPEVYLYSPFGQLHSTTTQNPWRYLSKHTDDETGLIFFGRRYYDPSAGRFLTADPKGYTDSLNLYAFSLNDPFMLMDPYGLENEPSNLSSIALSSATTFGSGAFTGLVHPIDSAWALSGDLAVLGQCAISGDFSRLTNAWKTMDWDQRCHFFSFQASRIVGLGLAVAGGSEIYHGARLTISGVYHGGKTAFQTIGKWALPRIERAEAVEANEIITVKQLSNPYMGIKQASKYLQDLGVSRARRVPILQSFEAESMTICQASQSEFGLRYFSNPNRVGGSYLFESFPASRSSLAIRYEWNAMSGFRQFQIRPGTTILEGRTAAQGPYLPGGQIQKFVINWREDLFLP